MNKIEKAIADNADLNKVMAVVTRKNGVTETVDLSKRFFGMTKDIADRIRRDNAKLGTTVVRIYRKVIKTNIRDLERAYNNFQNEGGEGYIPDFSDDPRLTIEIVTEEF